MKNPSIKKNIKNKQSPPLRQPILKLPHISINFSEKVLNKAKMPGIKDRMPNLSKPKLNTKSIYQLNRSKNTYDYEFQDNVRRQVKQLKKIRQYHSKGNKENIGKNKFDKLPKLENKSVKKTSRSSTVHKMKQRKNVSINQGKAQSEENNLFNKIQNFLMDPRKPQKNFASSKIKNKIMEKMKSFKEKYGEDFISAPKNASVSDSLWKKSDIKQNYLSIDPSDFPHEVDKIANWTENNENSIKHYLQIMYYKQDLDSFKKYLGKISKKRI